MALTQASTSQTNLAELASTHPGATRVFQSVGLDFCCHGRRTLAEACAEKGLDPATILSAIEGEDAGPGDLTVWRARPLSDLIDFIVTHYHDPLRAELPQLIALAAKVEEKHAGKSGCPSGLTEHLRAVHASILDHLMKEERILFPMILARRGAMAAAPIQVMEDEHEDHGRNLERTRALTGGLQVPEGGCPTWSALYLRLGRLESDLMDHIHLENNVLFPRTLCE